MVESDEEAKTKDGSPYKQLAYLSPADRSSYRVFQTPDTNTACDSFSMVDSVACGMERGKVATPMSATMMSSNGECSVTHTKHNSLVSVSDIHTM